jgi:hypothetical protein
MTRLLIVGTGRSGKTWTGSGLALAENAEYLDEPDNQFLVPYAFGVKRRSQHRVYPFLSPGDEAPGYEELWDHAFHRRDSAGPYHLKSLRQPVSTFLLQGGGARFSRLLHLGRSTASTLYGQRTAPVRLALAEKLALPKTPSTEAEDIIVASAYAHLSAEWIAERCQASVVIVRRDLRSVLASWITQRWLEASDAPALEEVDPGVLSAFSQREQVALPGPEAPPIVRAAWLLGFLSHSLRELAQRHPEWPVVDYEELVSDPHTAFPRVAAQVGLEWTSDSARKLESRRAFTQSRSASLHVPLSPAHWVQLVYTLEPFELGEWSPDSGRAG